MMVLMDQQIVGLNLKNAGFGLDCMNFQIIVDGDPNGSTICSLGINENCLGFTQQNEFITCENIPGPCFPNYFIESTWRRKR